MSNNVKNRIKKLLVELAETATDETIKLQAAVQLVKLVTREDRRRIARLKAKLREAKEPLAMSPRRFKPDENALGL
jgi:hypothetical protein